MDNFHLMAKPAGPSCNLDCTYCFYLEKEAMFSDRGKTQMSEEVLEAYTVKYIASQEGKEVNFAWQGGEPTLYGLDFFRKAVRLQKKHNKGKRISNSLQTNGTLINEEWCRFLAKHDFLVGLSLDGPDYLHNAYRKNKAGGQTHSRVVKTLNLFRQFGVDFNVLATVNDRNSREPLEVYRFLKNSGAVFIQFIPIVEREKEVLPWSVGSEDYGDFLIAVFNEWVRHDIGTVFVMNFEWAFSSAINGVSGICQFAPVCGKAGIIEHNGDIYSCDHFVYPENRIGNILADDLSELFSSPQQRDFGEAKQKGLSDRCRSCPVLRLCYGGCPKHRFVDGQNYLCPSYKKFFSHILPFASAARELINQNRPITELMETADRLS